MSGKNPFNFGTWASGLEGRVKSLEDYLTKFSAIAKQNGMGEGTAVMEQGLQKLEQDLLNIKARHTQFAREHKDMRSIVSGLDDGTRRFEAVIRGIESQIQQLSYHVGIYGEVVQGVAIRPERAVPALRTERDGAAYINPVKVHTKTFSLAATPRGKITVPANGTNQISFVVPPEQNMEGDMEIFFLELASATSTSLRVQISHTGLGGVYLMNQPVHILSAFGNMNQGAQPFSMYETIFLEPGLELTVKFFDFSGAPNDVEVIAHGRKFIGYTTAGMDRRGLINAFARNTWPFWLTTDQPVQLTAGANVATPFSMTIPRQYHAELAKAMQFGTIGGVSCPVEYHIQMSEGQSGNLLLDTVPINTVAGNGNFSFPFPEPYLALRGTQLMGNMYNDSGLASQTTDFVIHGRALPMSFPGQRSLEPLLDGREIDLPPASNKDLAIPRMISQ